MLLVQTVAFPGTYRGDVRVGGGHFHQVNEVWLVLPGGIVVIDVQQRDVHLQESKQVSGSTGSWGSMVCVPGDVQQHQVPNASSPSEWKARGMHPVVCEPLTSPDHPFRSSLGVYKGA